MLKVQARSPMNISQLFVRHRLIVSIVGESVNERKKGGLKHKHWALKNSPWVGGGMGMRTL